MRYPLGRHPIYEFTPCRTCGCTPENQCPGGCNRDPYSRIGTIGLCSACMSQRRALNTFPGTKIHADRRNTPSKEEVEQLGGWRCLICLQEYDYLPDEGGRVLGFFRHADDPAALGLVCSILAPGNISGPGGCAGPLGRIARGTRHGSVRRLKALKEYRDNPLEFGPRPDLVDRRIHRVAENQRSQGVQVTAADVAGMYVAAGDCCQICKLPRTMPPKRNNLHIDHDHEHQRVRGVLCGGCNSSMDLLDRDPLYYERARWLFRDAQGIRSAPWYRTPPWYHDMAPA
ncbi:hypothetical protein HKK74_31965 [Actinomadura alba]|uniref:Recombination endonuclease VII n=3 Tax=Actinomadura alba TaxID=406431 RepID=A0ABR7LYY7_9ACTN|nr:hypothetical protein [Actinomadura alba]